MNGECLVVDDDDDDGDVITMMISRYHDDGDDHLEILFHRQASSNEEYLEQKVSRGYCCPFCSPGDLHPGRGII